VECFAKSSTEKTGFNKCDDGCQYDRQNGGLYEIFAHDNRFSLSTAQNCWNNPTTVLLNHGLLWPPENLSWN